MPSTIETVHREFKHRGLVIWAVNIQEPAPHVASWIRQKGVTVPVLLDADGAVTKRYRVTGTPTAVLIDRDGQLVARAVGTRGWDTDKGRALLGGLLSMPRP